MFHSRPLQAITDKPTQSSPKVFPLIKMICLVIVLLVISTNNIPQLFAEQIADRAGINVSKRLKKYRIINLDQVPETKQSKSKPTASTISKSKPINSNPSLQVEQTTTQSWGTDILAPYS